MSQKERNPQVVAEFQRRRARQLAVIAPVVLAILALLWAEDHPHVTIAGLPATVLIGVAVAVIAGFLWFSVRNWRCPACDRYLGKAFNPRFCAHCGVPLQ